MGFGLCPFLLGGLKRGGGLEGAVDGAEDPAEGDDDDDEKGSDDGGGGKRVHGGQPGEEDGERVFSAAEGDVGEGFRRRGDSYAHGGLAGVCGEGDEAASDGCSELQLGGELGGGAEGDEGGHWDANEGVKGVPEEVEGGEFVCEEFDNEKGEGGGDDPPTGDEVEGRRESEEMGVSEDSESGNGGVDVEASGKADGNDEGGKFGAGEVERHEVHAGQP